MFYKKDEQVSEKRIQYFLTDGHQARRISWFYIMVRQFYIQTLYHP
jgi:hypothetical protein